MPTAYYLTCKNGNKYTDQNNVEREGSMQVGRVITTTGGNMMCIIDGLPFSALHRKEPLVLYMNPPREPGENVARPTSHAPAPPSNKDDLQDDIPF